MPAAIMALPATMSAKESPANVSNEPADATSRNTVHVSLGPRRSARTPQGICMTVYVQKYTLLRIPTDPPTSSTMSTPTMLTDIRWK